MIVFLLSSCCFAITCAYMQLKRRYEKLETKRAEHARWLATHGDPESSRASSFATKLNKAKKELHKISKSGA